MMFLRSLPDAPSRLAGICLRWGGGALALLILLSLGTAAGAGQHQTLASPAEADSLFGQGDRPLIFDTNLGLIERATAEAVGKALDGLRLPPGSSIRLHSLTNHEGAWFVEDFIARHLSSQGYSVHLVQVPVSAKESQNAGGGPASSSPSTGGLADAMNATRQIETGGAARGDSAAADTSSSATPPGSTGGPRSGPGSGSPAAGVGPAARTGVGPGGKQPPVEEIIPIPEGEGMVLTFRVIQFGVTYHDSWRRGFMGPQMVERLASVDVYCRLVSGDAEHVMWVGAGKSERLDIVPKAKLDLLEGMSYPFSKPELRVKPLSRLLEPILVTGIVGGLVYLFYANQK